MKEAMFYEKLEEGVLRCRLCPHFCVLKEGEIGKCGVRKHQNGKIYSLVYGKAIATSVDPIEKKPLFHFIPGTLSYSVATVGCNLSCRFCQNADISQVSSEREIRGVELSPQEIVEDALENDCESIAYTYTEPTIFFEYAYDTAKIARSKGLKNIFVSNGFTTRETIAKASEVIDAVNIDLKGFSEAFYGDVCGARLEPVLDAIREYHKRGIWIEVTTLIVPGHNDDEKMIEKIAKFIASVDKKIPWHISRFHPSFKMKDTPVTSTDIIHKAFRIGEKAGIKYIYSGNVPGDKFESTYCPNCDEKVMSRFGFSISEWRLKDGRCMNCGHKIDLVLE